MDEKKENLFVRFLKKLGFIKEIEIPKSYMCQQAQSVCHHKCDTCAWYEEETS